MGNKALLICDMLNDFVQEGAPLEVPGVRKIVPNIRREMDKAHEQGVPVIFICDSHTADDPELAVWPPHAMKGSAGEEIIPELAPSKNDIIIPKTRYEGFYNTNLNETLRSLQVEDVILTGVATEICIHYTGASAIMRGYRVIVPEDCVCGIDETNAASALSMLKEVLQPPLNTKLEGLL